MRVEYLTVNDLIEINKYVLKAFHDKKGDKHEILDMVKILDLIFKVERLEGDVYEKAAYLMLHITKGHPFASGNKRTAYTATKKFLSNNQKTYKFKDDNVINPKIMIAIREGRYTLDEIKEWITYGRVEKTYER